MQTKDFEKAEQAFDQALDLDPENETLKINKAKMEKE